MFCLPMVFWALSLLLASIGLADAASVTLAWDAATHDVQGKPAVAQSYQLYWGLQLGGPYPHARQMPGTMTTATVTDLDPRRRTYFVVTATGPSGAESDWSNEVFAEVTPPATGEQNLIALPTLRMTSSRFPTTHPRERLFDGLVGTSPPPTGIVKVPKWWIDFDFGQRYHLTRVRLFGDLDGTWRSTSYSLWTRQAPSDPWVRAAVSPALGNRWFEVPLAATARYARVEVVGPAAGTQARELEIYGHAVTP